MSLPEVRRSLKKHGIKLVDFETFEKIDVNRKKAHFWNSYIVTPPNDDRKIDYWYMPSVTMYDSSVVAEFKFENNRLVGVQVRIIPFNDKNSVTVAQSIAAHLKTKHKFINKVSTINLNAINNSDKHDVQNEDMWQSSLKSIYWEQFATADGTAAGKPPEDYYLIFESDNSVINFCINIYHESEPKLLLDIKYLPSIEKQKAKILSRQAAAFSQTKRVPRNCSTAN